MKTRNIIMGVVVALIFVGALVGVIVGVTTHSEGGFIDGAPAWTPEDMPLGVSASVYTAEGLEPADRGTVEHAMALYGEDFFVWTDGGEADVVILVGVPAEPGWMDPGGDARLVHTGGRAERCEAQTSNTGTTELLWMTIAHELGHCLGLAHDDFDLSIMRRVQRPAAMGAFPPKVTDHDRALLRARYRL